MRTTDRLRNLNFRYYNYTLHGTYEGTQKKKRIKKNKMEVHTLLPAPGISTPYKK